MPDDAALRTIEQANLNLLHTLFALDIHAGDYSDDPSAFAAASELKRLDFKVSLLVEMVGRLFAMQQAVPAEHALTLTVGDIHWLTDQAPEIEALIQLELYCNLSYPRPIILHAKVDDVLSSDTEGLLQVSALFCQHSAQLQEALERYIFLQHRRFVANRRSNHQR